MRLRLICVFVLLCGLAAPVAAHACAHDMCVTGEPLDDTDPACDACVADICAADAYCCNGWWDNLCVEMVSTVCGLNVCIAACAHSLCEAGDPLDATCNSCATKVCQADPICCDSQWDATCVGLVETTCGNARCQQGGGRCEDAVVINYEDPPVVLLGTLNGMPKEGCASEGESCNNAAAWYSYTVPYGTDFIRHINTCGSEYSFGTDTVLSLHSDCPGDLSTEVLANDDWMWGSDPFACKYNVPRRLLDSATVVPWMIPGGATYKIRVSHAGGTPATDYQLFVPEPSSALLRCAGLGTLLALSRWRQRRRGRSAAD